MFFPAFIAEFVMLTSAVVATIPIAENFEDSFSTFSAIAVSPCVPSLLLNDLSKLSKEDMLVLIPCSN